MNIFFQNFDSTHKKSKLDDKSLKRSPVSSPLSNSENVAVIFSNPLATRSSSPSPVFPSVAPRKKNLSIDAGVTLASDNSDDFNHLKPNPLGSPKGLMRFFQTKSSERIESPSSKKKTELPFASRLSTQSSKLTINVSAPPLESSPTKIQQPHTPDAREIIGMIIANQNAPDSKKIKGPFNRSNSKQGGVVLRLPSLEKGKNALNHANSENSLSDAFLMSGVQTFQSTENPKDSQHIKKKTVDDLVSDACIICNSFGFKQDEDDFREEITLAALMFLEGMQAKVKFSIKSMEKEWKLKKKTLKQRAKMMSVLHASKIGSIFDHLVSKYPSNAKYINLYLDGILEKWIVVSPIPVSNRNANKSPLPTPTNLNQTLLDPHSTESKDVLLKMFSVSYFLKSRISILRRLTGIRKIGKKKSFNWSSNGSLLDTGVPDLNNMYF